MSEIIIEYECKRKDMSMEELNEIKKQANDPNLLHGKDAAYALYHMMGWKSIMTTFHYKPH